MLNDNKIFLSERASARDKYAVFAVSMDSLGKVQNVISVQNVLSLISVQNVVITK